MRKILMSLLLASAAASPALAQHDDKSDRQQAREERQQAREERQQARQESRSEARTEHNAPQGGQSGDYARSQQVNVPQQNFSGGGSQHVNVERGHGNAYPNGTMG